MESDRLQKFRKLLLQERERLLNNSREAIGRAELALPVEDLPDETDLAAHEIHQSVSFQLRNREHKLLKEIDNALERIEAGTYGICEETEEPIEIERLLAVPWTRFSVGGAEARESRKKRFA